MSSVGAKLEFDTMKYSDVPRPGQRKRIKINGKPETLYVSRVEVEAYKFYDGLFVGIGWRGSAEFIPYNEMGETHV